MRKIGKCLALLGLCGCLCLGGRALPAEAAEIREIRSPQELQDMAGDPSGSYRLMADIDMTDVSWEPLAFSGSFDGNGYAILNLKIASVGQGVEDTYDGNRKVYDTSFAGFFDTLKGASVTGLNLINLRIDVDTQQPCFVGGIAGYMEDSIIENSSVQGILQLRACDRMFGVGGMIGYGCGSIRNTAADVTLVCIDTDASTRDEQFMGGVCAAGYPDINGCSVKIDGYDSDHGYVHDGGLVGMYIFYPQDVGYYGSITDNSVTGRITFFEDNTNRRAYCDGFIGEIMNWNFENGRNASDFQRDERFEYDVDLLPHSCERTAEGAAAIVWEETVTAPGCDSFGYTTRRCSVDGYTETDNYTLKSHDLTWETVREATYEEPGLERGTCKNCEYSEERELAKLEPTPTPTPEAESVPAEDLETPGPGTETAETEEGKLPAVPLTVLVIGIACVVTVVILAGRKRRSK